MSENIERDISHMRKQLNELYTALMGDKISNDGGLVRRIEVVENKVSAIGRKANTTATYVKILWGTAGAIIMAIYSLIIKSK